MGMEYLHYPAATSNMVYIYLKYKGNWLTVWMNAVLSVAAFITTGKVNAAAVSALGLLLMWDLQCAAAVVPH